MIYKNIRYINKISRKRPFRYYYIGIHVIQPLYTIDGDLLLSTWIFSMLVFALIKLSLSDH